MPRRPVDPAVRQQAFLTWLDTEEVRIWRKLLEAKKGFGLITSTTPDLTDRWEPFLSTLHSLSKMLKCAKKSPSYDQEVFRTAFFAQLEKDVDGWKFELPKMYVDPARDCRMAFVDVWEFLEKLNEVTDEDYVQVKKDFTKKLSELEKTYLKHKKPGHELLWSDYLRITLKPLYDTIEANNSLYSLMFRTHPKKRWFKQEAPEFRMEACKTLFCEALTRLVTKLHAYGNLGNLPVPNIEKSMEKLAIDTAHNPCLKAFINPVKNAWVKMRRAFRDKWREGFNRYKQPLKDNADIEEVLMELLTRESLAEHLLGTPLKRDQLEFVYDIVEQVFHSPLKAKLLSKDNDVIFTVIPQMSVFKGLMQVSQVRQEITEKIAELQELGQPLESARPKTANADPSDQEERYEGVRRMWIWARYIRDSDMPTWERLSYEVGNINIMVQEDVLDFIIAQHIKRRNLKAVHELRPPYIWNYQVAENRYVKVEEVPDVDDSLGQIMVPPDNPNDLSHIERHFRETARPLDCYIDGRVQRVLKEVEHLAINLVAINKEIWKLLVTQVIKTFEDELPNLEDDKISTDEDELTRQTEEVKQEL
mmetsp:Transcript_8691/g.16973  ORF Transcript_8691/g.16973 Transcript_8691/m.16973 type:complete len:589 (+) Transcript_8691:615-2381(+)